jgi:hypothetical protein
MKINSKRNFKSCFLIWIICYYPSHKHFNVTILYKSLLFSHINTNTPQHPEGRGLQICHLVSTEPQVGKTQRWVIHVFNFFKLYT